MIFRENNSVHTTVYRKSFAVSLPTHRLPSHPTSQKFVAFNTYVYMALKNFSLENFLKAELHYIKSLAIDLDFTVKIVDSIYDKLSKRSNTKFNIVSNEILIILPYFPKTGHQTFKIWINFGFKIAHTPFNKIKFSNLKHATDILLDTLRM